MVRKRLFADGINLEENRAFQSFITRVYGCSGVKSYIYIPTQIGKHLRLQSGDVLEIGIRKVTRDYAEKNYGVQFWSFRTICPRCGKEGTVHPIGRYGVAIFHHEKGKSGRRKVHYISREVLKTLKPVEGSF
jgi:hypothetical protein